MGLTRMNPYFLSVVLILHIFDFYFDLGFCLTVTLNGCGQRTFVELAFPMEYDNFDLGFTAKDGPQSEAAWIRIGLPFIPDGGKEYTTQDPNTGTSVTERLKVNDTIKEDILVGLGLMPDPLVPGSGCPECVTLNFTVTKEAIRVNKNGALKTEKGEVTWRAIVRDSPRWDVATVTVSVDRFKFERTRPDSAMFMRLIKESTLSDEKMAFNFGPENPRPPTCSWTATVFNCIVVADILSKIYMLSISIKNNSIQGFHWRQRLGFFIVPGSALIVEGYECYEVEQDLFTFVVIQVIDTVFRTVPCLWMELLFGIAGTKGFSLSLAINAVLSVLTVAVTLVIFERSQVDGER